MNSKIIEYFDGSQALIGELFFEGQGKQPTIIVFPAFEGRGSFAVNYAKDLVKQGFAAFVVDMYGDAEVAETIDDCFKLIGPFLQDRSLVRRRAQLAYDALIKETAVDANKLGAVGFCFGGMCVLELVRSGANLRAGVSMHGVLGKSDLPTLPFKTKLLILHGYQDPQVPPSSLQQFAEEMSSVQVYDWIFTFFGDAKHSFTDPKTGTFDPQKEVQMGRAYNEAAAKRSFRYAVDFFKEYL